MKKVVISFMLLTASVFGTMQAQCVEKGSIIIDGFYGFPDLYGSFFRSAVETSGATGISVGSVGPLGGKFEYMFTDKVGLGAVIGYGNTIVKYNDVTSGYDYQVSIPRFRAMASFNLHFGTSDTFDPYWMLGAGYSNLAMEYKTDDPASTEVDTNIPSVPVAFRTALGARYFFIPNLGVNMEIGFGSGALVQAGISAKF